MSFTVYECLGDEWTTTVVGHDRWDDVDGFDPYDEDYYWSDHDDN